MKEPSLNKRNNGDKILGIILIILIVFLSGGFICAMEAEQMSTFEIIFFTLPGILILAVGGSLYCFFHNQIVDIRICNDDIIFIRANGKCVSIDRKKDIKVLKSENGYTFFIENTSKLYIYKYRPFNIVAHKRHIDELIEILIKEGFLRKKI